MVIASSYIQNTTHVRNKKFSTFPLLFFLFVRNVDYIPDVMDYSLMTFDNTTKFFPQAFHLNTASR